MNKKLRITQQRVLFREAMGKLHAAAELFGVEEFEGRTILMKQGEQDLKLWKATIAEFERWVLDESPLA